MSQAEKDNISELRNNNRNIRYSLKPDEAAEKANRVRAEISSTGARAIQAGIDKYHSLAILERVVKGGVQDATKSAWKMALMTANVEQVMFHLLEKGGIKYDRSSGEFNKRDGVGGLKEILNPVRGKNYQNFENFAKAKSAIERFGFLRNKPEFIGRNFGEIFGFSLAQAKKWVAEGNEASKKAFAQLQVFFQSNRDFMLETGLITPAQHEALSRFKNYIPFFREGKDLEEETEKAYERATELYPAGRGFSGRDAGVKKFVGSSRRTKNLIENIVNQTRRVMDAGYKNIAAARI